METVLKFTRHLALTLSASLLAMNAHAANIEVRGNYRVSAEFIQSHLPQKSPTQADMDNAVKTLFATDRFENVSIKRRGDISVIEVSEHRVVNSIRIAGNERIATKKLVDKIGLNAGDAFSSHDLSVIKTNIIDAYHKTGRLDVAVTIDAQSISDMRSNIVITVAEGSRTGVSSINFKGNDSFSAASLRTTMSTRSSGLFSWLFNNDVYLPEKLSKDEEGIKAFYAKKGYPDAEVLLTDVNRGPKGYDIEVMLDEGDQVTLTKASLDSSSALFGLREAAETLRGVEGNPYDPALLESAQTSIEDAAIDSGMISPTVSVRTDRRNATDMHVTFTVDEGSRTYVERIDINGNTDTKDYVIRREIDFSEGDLLTKAGIRAVKKRLNNLGIFESVQVKVSKGSAADRSILAIDVKEKKTGEFSIGGGFSQVDGIIATGGLSQSNLFGTGRGASLSAGVGDDTNDFALTFREPYLFGNRITAETSVFVRSSDIRSGGIDAYEELTKGGRISLEAPVSDKIFAHVIYRLESRQAKDISDKLTGAGTAEDPNLISGKETLKSSVGYEIAYNTLDNNLAPTKGNRLAFSQEYAGLGGDVSFIKSQIGANHFQELSPSKSLVGQLGFKAGHIAGLQDKPLAFMDHFRGRDTHIRGFERSGYGPYDAASGYHLGGTYFFTATAEAKMPLPLIPEEYGLKGVIFSDAGSVWNPDSTSVSRSGSHVSGDDAKIRASVGAGIEWNSPFGLFKADFGIPVIDQDGDQKQVFSFSGGTRF